MGNYTEPSRNGWQGFLESETAGTWSAATVPLLPVNASSNQEPMEIGGLSCTSVGYGTAIGTTPTARAIPMALSGRRPLAFGGRRWR